MFGNGGIVILSASLIFGTRFHRNLLRCQPLSRQTLLPDEVLEQDPPVLLPQRSEQELGHGAVPRSSMIVRLRVPEATELSDLLVAHVPPRVVDDPYR